MAITVSPRTGTRQTHSGDQIRPNVPGAIRRDERVSRTRHRAAVLNSTRCRPRLPDFVRQGGVWPGVSITYLPSVGTGSPTG